MTSRCVLHVIFEAALRNKLDGQLQSVIALPKMRRPPSMRNSAAAGGQVAKRWQQHRQCGQQSASDRRMDVLSTMPESLEAARNRPASALVQNLILELSVDQASDLDCSSDSPRRKTPLGQLLNRVANLKQTIMFTFLLRVGSGRVDKDMRSASGTAHCLSPHGYRNTACSTQYCANGRAVRADVNLTGCSKDR